MKPSSELINFLGPKFILVLEPSANYRASLKNFLTNLKVKNVRFVSSVAEAKREMLTIKVGLFIVEWMLSEKNGLQFCREMRRDKHYKNTPFLLLSTENLRQDVMLASEGGINSYLLKPFSYEDFQEKIRQILSGANSSNPLNSLIERAIGHIESQELWVAEALIKEALTIKPTSAKALCALGRIGLANRDLEFAMTCFENALSHNPEFVDAHKFILQVAEERKSYNEIIKAAGILHALSPDNPRYTLLIAMAHMEQGNLAESEAFFKTSILLSPTLADGHKGLGTVYLQQREFEKARKSLEKALDLEKGDVSTLNSLGLAYVRQNKLDEGILKYRIALSIDSRDHRVLFNLGLALELKGDLEGCQEFFEKAVAADPTFEKAARNLDRIKKLRHGAAKPESPSTPDDDEIFINPSLKLSA